MLQFPEISVQEAADMKTAYYDALGFVWGKGGSIRCQELNQKDPDGVALEDLRKNELQRTRDAVRDNCMVVLVGPSGAGKSHLLRSIERDGAMYYELPHGTFAWRNVEEYRQLVFEEFGELSAGQEGIETVVLDELANDNASVSLVQQQLDLGRRVVAGVGGMRSNESKIFDMELAYYREKPVFVEMSYKPLNEMQILELMMSFVGRECCLGRMSESISHLMEFSSEFPVDINAVRALTPINMRGRCDVDAFKEQTRIMRNECVYSSVPLWPLSFIRLHRRFLVS
ncbi:ABC transporter ATP-binding protein [Patescibacteria group bacterium]|nr:ABC transporter ATP-binding protein [Patescibacteria group bacterium]